MLFILKFLNKNCIEVMNIFQIKDPSKLFFYAKDTIS